jgi:hypothetical protein
MFTFEFFLQQKFWQNDDVYGTAASNLIGVEYRAYSNTIAGCGYTPSMRSKKAFEKMKPAEKAAWKLKNQRMGQCYYTGRADNASEVDIRALCGMKFLDVSTYTSPVEYNSNIFFIFYRLFTLVI